MTEHFASNGNRRLSYTNQASPGSTDALKIAFVGTYLPRKCGIATFTHDLRFSVANQHGEDATPVIAICDSGDSHEYPAEVVFKIQAQNIASYERAADFLNRSDVNVVCLQHEFGIFGGSAGGNVLALIRALKAPVVTTLHTVLLEPTPEQRKVMECLIAQSQRLVVMTERGRMMLCEIYDAPGDKIDIIEHGIHDVPYEEPEHYKGLFDMENRLVLLTFGLLSPNKGIEHVLEALPTIITEFPQVVYMILGATHPNLLREEGEAYRLGLESLAKRKNIDKNIVFYNRFADLKELTDFIGAADIYLTPYLNERQIVSGTLAYAFGAGKAVISTPYWHATELLADGRGVIVPFADSKAIAREVCALLRDEPRRRSMRERAFEIGRNMLWSSVAKHYLKLFALTREHGNSGRRQSLLVRTLADEPIGLPAHNPDHILRMSDSTGILQHALYSLPNYSHGYCTDDNARALILMLIWDDLGESSPALNKLTSTYVAFLAYALHPDTKRFRNFMGYNRNWLEAEGSEDSHGRAIWALGVCVEKAHERGISLLAEELFIEGLLPVAGLVHPRTWAFALLGIDAYLRKRPENNAAKIVRTILVQRLMRLFADHARDNWHWLADDATYDNARLTQALILCGHAMKEPDVLETGLRALRWLVRIQTSNTGYFQPIGSDGFCHRNGARAFFDQQPVEVQGTVSACLDAFNITSDVRWLEHARIAFEWFLGRNDLGLLLYDTKTGGCRDALHVDRVNENQGAESTLAFHLALAQLRTVHIDLATFQLGPVLTSA